MLFVLFLIGCYWRANLSISKPIYEYNLDPISRSNKFPVLRAFGWRANLSISKPIYEYN
jgi:hypothetical protein